MFKELKKLLASPTKFYQVLPDMEAAKFGSRWALMCLETRQGLCHQNPKTVLEQSDTELLDTNLPYPYVFLPETSFFRLNGKSMLPVNWNGCGVKTKDMALGMAVLWEIAMHINEARKEKNPNKQIGHIKGAIFKQDLILKKYPVIKEMGFEIVQPHWIAFYRLLFDVCWARLNHDIVNKDIIVIAGRAFKQIDDLKLDRDASACAKTTFQHCLVKFLLLTLRPPWSQDSGEVQAGGEAARIGRKLASTLPKGSKLSMEAHERFERLRCIGWENEAKHSCEELNAQLNEWIKGDFDRHPVDMPSLEILQ